MRSTVKLDDDVVAAVERLRSEQQLGFSAAVNALARAGAASMGATPSRARLVLPTVDLGDMLDVSNVAEALEFEESHDDR